MVRSPFEQFDISRRGDAGNQLASSSASFGDMLDGQSIGNGEGGRVRFRQDLDGRGGTHGVWWVCCWRRRRDCPMKTSLACSLAVKGVAQVAQQMRKRGMKGRIRLSTHTQREQNFIKSMRGCVEMGGH